MTAKKSIDQIAEVQRIINILHRWGIHTLGQFADLDKDDLGRRLGPTAVALWERANGKRTRLLKLVPPVESFAETFEFENEIETVEPLLFILRRFLEQISLRLGAFYFVAKELHLQITFSDKKNYEHRFKIPQPTRSVEVLFRMLHTHLENFRSEFPIVAVSLEAQASKPMQQQFGLFETALRDPAQLSETLARLTGLLGADRVGTPVLEDTHRPDAFRMEPFSWELPNELCVVDADVDIDIDIDVDVDVDVDVVASAVSADKAALRTAHATAADKTALRTAHATAVALRRFRPSVFASVLSAENHPVHLQSTGPTGSIQTAGGPYHSSGNWWDENAWRRAEWDLELENGALCRCHEDDGVWKVDGVYD